MKSNSTADRSGLWLLLLLAIVSVPVLSWCQGSLGGITGHVTDSSGGSVPGTSVKIRNLDTGAETTVVATQEGTYFASGLTPGRYQVTVSKAGFKTITQQPVIVSTATTSTLDFLLAVGAVTESVTVAGDAPQLQTTSAEIGTVMPEKEMLDLPISLGGAATTGATGRRQIQNFIYLTPGVTGNQWATSINGAPGMSAAVLIDGEDSQNIGAPGFIAESAPPYEAVSEFKVQNTLYPAQYGLGFGIMNFTMKSGTNAFHGDLFEFVRNDVFDALGYFSAGKVPIRQNEYGGTVGGPVILPHYNGRDKTHFFVAWSGFQLRGGLPTGGLVTLPTMQERNGDFSDYPLPIYNPATTRSDGSGGSVRDPYPNNMIPASQISAVTKRLLALLPPPDFPNQTFFNYVDRSNQPSSDYDWSVKVDHQINEKQSISGSGWWVNASTVINGQVAGQLNQGFHNAPTNAVGLRFNHVWTASPTLLNRAGFGFTQVTPTWAVSILDPREGNQTLQIPGIPSDSHGFTEFHFNTVYPFLGNSSYTGYDPQLFKNFVWNDDVSWEKGRHQLQLGFEYRFRTIDCRDQTLTAGSLSFSSQSTSQPDDPNFQNWGNPFASLMVGQVFSGIHAIPAPEQHFHDNFFALYAQDAFKISKRLTLSLGLRYELPIYIIEDSGEMSLFSPTRPNPGAGELPGALRFLGNGAGRTGTFNLFGKYGKSFSPRIAIAYQLNEKTVFRTGYGIFRLYPNYGDLNNPNSLVFAPGFGATDAVASTNSGITPAFVLDQGFPAANVTVPNFDPSQNNGGTVTWINWKANVPANLQSWTFDIQRSLPFNFLADAAYVGSHVLGIWAGLENINQVNPTYLNLGNLLNEDISSPEAAAAGIKVPYPGFTGSVAQALRPYPQYTTINDFYQPSGYGVYNSFQGRLEKRYSNGLTFLGSYTLSKNIGVEGANTFGSTYGAANLTSLNTYNQKAEKAILPIDRTHVFIVSWTYELPFGRGKQVLGDVKPWLNQFVGGWQINAIQTYESGTPVSVTGGGNIPLFGGGNRPNQVSSHVRSSVSMSNFNPATDVYLNINAFSQPAPFTFGNAPAQLPNVRTPALYDEDVSLFKKFFLGESRNLEFRAEVFDVFNRVVFGGPSANVNNPSTFGVISTQANTPRVIQLAMKFTF